jgi:2-keto-4-pentenoate hydratase/2-oxohepta-3-ene-1,7-dioic acid hydratase in catechol pathway
LASHQGIPIKAHEIIGDTLDINAHLTDRLLTVKTLLCPLSREQLPPARCLGLNYADHAAEFKRVAPVAPVLFYKPNTSIIGPNAKIVVPLVAQPVKEHLPDYEVEFVAVIGKPAKNVSEADALDYILAYTGANDVCLISPSCVLYLRQGNRFRFESIKWLSRSGDILNPLVLLCQLVLSEANCYLDDTNPLGPCLVSASMGSISDPQSVPLKCVLNGRLMQDGNTKDQIFSLRQTIAHLSSGTTLLPGTIILTGNSFVN